MRSILKALLFLTKKELEKIDNNICIFQMEFSKSCIPSTLKSSTSII